MPWTRCWIDNGNVPARLSCPAGVNPMKRGFLLIAKIIHSFERKLWKGRERSQKKVICSCIVLRQRNWPNIFYYGMTFDWAMFPYRYGAHSLSKSIKIVCLSVFLSAYLSVCLSFCLLFSFAVATTGSQTMASDRKRSQNCCFHIIPEFLPFLWSFCDHRKIKHSAETQKQKSLKKFGG